MPSGSTASRRPSRPCVRRHEVNDMLLEAKKIKTIPDWNKALREEFLKQASA